MNRYILALAAALLLTQACKKSSNTTTTPNNTTTTSPYYFKFSLTGINYDLNANNPQYLTFYTDEAGGYQVGNAFPSLYPSIGLSFTWNNKDTVLESDLLGLAGKTLYFSDTAITPALTFDSSATSITWYSYDTSATSYYVKVATVTYVKKDTVLGTPIRVYLVSGSCNALMTQSAAPSLLGNGSFSFLISRQDL